MNIDKLNLDLNEIMREFMPPMRREPRHRLMDR